MYISISVRTHRNALKKAYKIHTETGDEGYFGGLRRLQCYW